MGSRVRVPPRSPIKFPDRLSRRSSARLRTSLFWEDARMWNCAKDWAQIAPGLTPVVAFIAVLVAWRQLALNRTNQRETTAKATFREFLKLCVQYPDFADGKPPSDKHDDYAWF